MNPAPITFLRVVFNNALGNCDMDFFNFRNCRVQNFKILNQSKRDQNFVVNFRKHRKQKQKLTKYIKIEQRQSIALLYVGALITDSHCQIQKLQLI